MKDRGGFSLSFNVRREDAAKMYSMLLQPHVDDLCKQYETAWQEKLKKLSRKQKKRNKKALAELISRSSGAPMKIVLKLMRRDKRKR